MAEPKVEHCEERLHGVNHHFNQYLEEFVYGGIDGSVTTFAVVAGSVGAHLDPSVVLILGFANLFADGLSMSIGSYLSAKTEWQKYQKHKAVEYWEVEHLPDAEREEIRQIYRAKGFQGPLLEAIVETITADKDRWVDVMMKEELGLLPPDKKPLWSGVATFLSFVLVGFVPLISYVAAYVFSLSQQYLFLWACILTALAFVGIGFLKAQVVAVSRWRAMLETLLLGAVAATVSYGVGALLKQWL